ncbi:MAG: hypothetical protein II992_11295 [Lachnospiraceae bacterium]|nr:hypothetical protein [Lachnospiraceae bacterium]
MSLIAPITDGKVESTAISTTKKDTTGTGTLGKDAFLQLLVAQMKYQDPLNPSSDTEWVAQMAQFSSLEQMQNMNSTITNSQAFSMIGQTVNIVTDSGEVEGIVEYASISDGVAYVSIDGRKYEASQVSAILSGEYLQEKYGPSVAQQKVTYNYEAPENIKLSVSLGSKDYAANGMYVAIGEKLIDSSHLSFDKEKNILTINKDAFVGLASGGTYDISFAFDDRYATSISEVVTLKVVGNQPSNSMNTGNDATTV